MVLKWDKYFWTFPKCSEIELCTNTDVQDYILSCVLWYCIFLVRHPVVYRFAVVINIIIITRVADDRRKYPKTYCRLFRFGCINYTVAYGLDISHVTAVWPKKKKNNLGQDAFRISFIRVWRHIVFDPEGSVPNVLNRWHHSWNLSRKASYPLLFRFVIENGGPLTSSY